MLLLAMSCLQARTQDAALTDLLELAPDGVQLTPGNLPSAGFRERVAHLTGAVRLHHGFAWQHYRRRVFDGHGDPLMHERARSLHPPRVAARPADRTDRLVVDARRWLPHAAAHDLLLETMYPGHVLGTGAELQLAMDLGIRLAVDVAHLHLQRAAGVLTAAVERRLLCYPRIEEVHVSGNDGRADRHLPLAPDTPGLAWARERIGELPVVLECYMHCLSRDERRRQVDLLRGAD